MEPPEFVRDPSLLSKRTNFTYTFENHCPEIAAGYEAQCVGWLNIPTQRGMVKYLASKADRESRIVVQEWFKLIEFTAANETQYELYDLKNDPNEIFNLLTHEGEARSGQHVSVLAELKAELM